MPQRTLVRARPRTARPPGLQGFDNSIDALYALMGITAPTLPLPVNDKTVRGLPAAWAAMNKISNAVGQMMTGAECFAGDGMTEIECPPVVDQPDSSLDSFTFWKQVACSSLCQGNWIGIKADYDPTTGYPRQVLGVPTGVVAPYYDPDGYVIYQINGEDFYPDDIVHVRCGITLPGEIMTIGVIEAHRRGLSGMIAQQGMANSVWQTGAVPSGIVQLDVDLPTQEQATTVKANWVSVVGGQRSVAVTGKRMTFTPITWSADDAQFIQSQQLSVAQIALMFGLHPSDLDASIGGTGMTYANRQDNILERVTESYTPVMLPIEQAWSRLIPGKNFVKGNVEALLRSTTMQRYEAHKLAQEIGLETKDETREIEGKPPLPKQDPPTPPPPLQLPPASPTDTQVSPDTAVSQAQLTAGEAP
jgi:HK97 family phage portal protein